MFSGLVSDCAVEVASLGHQGQQRKAAAKCACGQRLWLGTTPKSAETMRLLLAIPAPERKKTFPLH